MEVGTEISQKIRSAIKAKLIELGAYVDDELPDYIMVMVANKKSREQMISDLNLFLGKNTDTFAEWLHGLLGKLQTISVDANAVKSVKDKKKSDSKKEKRVKKSAKAEASSSQGKKIKSKKSESTDVKSDKAIDSKSKGSVDPNNKPNPPEHDEVEGKDSQSLSLSESQEVEDVRQMLVTVAPTDELAAELETTEARIEQSQLMASQTNKPTGPASEKSLGNNRLSTQRKRSASPTEERRMQSSSAPKKHKGLTSVVASVRKDEEEEEYDPLCPAVGSVASVVKVTSRKSKIPPALQANSVMMDRCGSEMEEVGENDQTMATEGDGSVSTNHGMAGSMVRLEQTASLDRIRSVLIEVLKQNKEDHLDDDITTFCESIASCMRKMNQRNLAIAKLRIQKILFDYESSIQSGGNDRWNSSTTNAAGGLISSSVLISSSGGGNKSNFRTLSKQKNSYTAHNTNNPSNLPTTCSNESTKLTISASKNSLVSTAPGLDSPSSFSPSLSSTTTQKSDNALVTSSSKNDRLGLFHHRHLPNVEVPSTKNINSPQTNNSENCLTQPKPHQQQSRSVPGGYRNMDHSESSPSQSISLDSLHLKRRSELESSLSSNKSSPSVLKFRPLLHNAQSGGSGDNNLGTDSPKPISAEQLKVLAKNLKITITNSFAKSSDDDDESSSEGSDEETDSEDEEEEVDENSGMEKVPKENDFRKDDSPSVETRNFVSETREADDSEPATSSAKESLSHEKNEAVIS